MKNITLKDGKTGTHAKRKLSALIKTIEDPEVQVDSDLIAFTGREVVVTPGELIFDRNLSDPDKMFWCALRMLCQSPDAIMRWPDQSELAEMLGKSRASVILYTKMLRATRWISVFDIKRVNNLPTRYAYAIHDHAMPIEEVLAVDHDYPYFLFEEATREKNVERLTSYCRKTLSRLSLPEYFSTDEIRLLGLNNFPLDHDNQNRPGNKILPGLPANHKNAIPDVNIIDNGDTPNTSINVNKLYNGEHQTCQKTDTESDADVNILDNGTVDSVNKLYNGVSTAVQKIDTAQNRPENAGNIYNRAYAPADAHTPTRGGIKTYGFNNTYIPTEGGECEGRDCESSPQDGPSPTSQPDADSQAAQNLDNERQAFFREGPITQLVPLIRDLYGNSTAHAIVNRIKLGRYPGDSGEVRHLASEDETAVILMSLIDRHGQIQSPLNYVDSLIVRAAQQELVFRGDQYMRYREMTGQTAIEAQVNVSPAVLEKQRKHEERLAALDIPDGTILIGKQTGNRYFVNHGFVTGLNDPNGNQHKVNPTKDGLQIGINEIDSLKALVLSGKLLVEGKS